MFLKGEIISQLGLTNSVLHSWTADDLGDRDQTKEKMKQFNFSPFKKGKDAGDLISYPDGWVGADVGEFRVRYNLYPCDKATVIG